MLNAQAWWPIAVIAVFAGLYYANRVMQHRFVVEEVAREEKKVDKPIRVSDFSFLSRFGQTGDPYSVTKPYVRESFPVLPS